MIQWRPHAAYMDASFQPENCVYKPYYIWRIFHNLGVSLDGWFKTPSARSMKTYNAEYDIECLN